MKFEFIKDHNGNKKGDVETMADSLGNYLVRVGVVKESKVVAKPKKDKHTEKAKGNDDFEGRETK